MNVIPERPATPNISRRSLQDRFADKSTQRHELAESGLNPVLDTSSTTSTFRIDHTGELVIDGSPMGTVGLNGDHSLGQLDMLTAQAYHLLALPPGVTGTEIETLANSVWNESGWTNPGVLHLMEGVTIEGPWSLTDQNVTALGFGTNQSSVWVLRCLPMRGAPPTPELRRIDDWANAFPQGMPVGSEHKTLLVLRRIARRLAGSLRVAGTGQIIAPDPDSAVNLRVYGTQYLDRSVLLHALQRSFAEAVAPPGVQKLAFRDPYAVLIPAGAGSQIVAGVRPVEQVPRVLRRQNWFRQTNFMYEFNWSQQLTDPNHQNVHMTRSARLERHRVADAIGKAAYTTAKMLGQAAVIDQDDFLIEIDELRPTKEEQRP